MKYCTIEVYSHTLRITDVQEPIREALGKIARNNIQYTLRKQRGRWIREGTKVFASRLFDGSEYRFHRHQLDEVLTSLEYDGFGPNKVNVVFMPSYDAVDMDVTMDSKFVIRDNQAPIIDYVVSDGSTKVVTLQTGGGKAARNSTPIKIPDGWKPIGDMQVGDDVIAPDGTTTKVTGVYPQGMVDLYRVTFKDGRWVDVCGEHLWKIYFDASGDCKVIDTTAILEYMKSSISEIYVPLVKPQVGLDVDSVMDRLIEHLGVVPHSKPVPNLSLADELCSLARSIGLLAEVEIEQGLPYVTIPSDHQIGLAIKSIEFVGRDHATCISVSHPERLYVTKDYIVTHNTFCGLKAAELIAKRLMIVVPAKYLDKWIGDVEEAYNLDRGKILVVQGQKALIALLDLYSREPIAFDVVIVTSTTFQDYFKNYERTGFYHMPEFYIRPEKLFEYLGVGFRIIDETHQFFHLNFKMDLYTHIPKALYLSATLVPDDKFTERMYQISYPKHLRMDGGNYVKYCHVSALHYRLVDYSKVRYTGGSGQYSHIVFEQWLMKNPKAMANYLEMIWKQVKYHFVEKRVDGQKCLIFAGLVDMCEIIRNYIEDKTDDFVVSKYNAEDDYEVLLGSDITVSTLGSAGTAVDIKNLLFCMMTVGLSGSQPNLQALGRLRELRNHPGQSPHFMYFVCQDINKHVEYHAKKKQLFKGRVLTHKTVYYDGEI